MVRKFTLSLTSCLATGLLLGTPGCATNAEPAALTLEVYAVKDLVFPADDDRPAFIRLDDLTINVREASGVDWDRPGHVIRSEGSGFLAVRATPAEHEKVAIVLTDMRRFAAKHR